MAQRKPWSVRVRRAVGGFVIDGFFRSASVLGRLHPLARPARHRVVVERGLRYCAGDEPCHQLDIYRPRDAVGPLPIVLYVHGGGFRILSKDTHWMMGLAFARAGYLVFNISYRLAPRHRFPAALQDCGEALSWVVEHATSLGGDLDRLVFAGESAGANLVTSLAAMTAYRRDEPWARKVFELGVVPRAVLPYCGILQVSDPGRFRRRKPDKISAFLDDRLSEVSDAYLGPTPHARLGDTMDLADPLVWLERGEAPDRPLPPCFATVGTRDPLLDDTRRLDEALRRLGVVSEARYYEGGVHAFHALVWRPEARECWADSFRFMKRHLSATR